MQKFNWHNTESDLEKEWFSEREKVPRELSCQGKNAKRIFFPARITAQGNVPKWTAKCQFLKLSPGQNCVK